MGVSSTKQLNICLISAEYPPETGFGGIGTYTFHLAHGLTMQGHLVTVLSRSLGKDQQYLDHKVMIFRIADKPIYIRGVSRVLNALTAGSSAQWWHSRTTFQKIRQVMASRGKFDIIEGPLWDAECCAYSRSIGVPLVVRLQTPIFKVREILSQPARINLERLEKLSLEKATLIATISNNVGDLVINRYGIDPKKVVYSPLGISLTRPRMRESRANSFKLLYVGRLETRKGIADLIDALPEILSFSDKVRVDIVGKDCALETGLDYTYTQYFKKAVPGHLQPQVKFYGYVEPKQLEALYRDCDVFIAPSLYESFGLIFLEAMAFGKPVIGTRVGGIPEVVKDGLVGKLVRPGSPKEIARAVLELLADRKLRQKLGENALRYVGANFSYEIMTTKTLQVYRQAIQSFYHYYEKR